MNGALIARRTGAFFIMLAMLASVLVIAAPTAFSQTLGSVSVGACDPETNTATVTITVAGDGEWSVDVYDSDNFTIFYTNASTTTQLPAGSYTYIVYETEDELKTPFEEGEFVIDCTPTETTVPQETTTLPQETTTVPQETTTLPQETTTTSEPEVLPTTTIDSSVSTVQQTSTTVPAVTGSTLPFTGLELETTAGIGVMAVIGGVLLLLGSRRRSDDEATEVIGSW